MKPHVGIANDNIPDVVTILNLVLADECLLYTKTRNCHWNVTGPAFQQLHKLFEQQYDQLSELIDEVAERVRMLGGRAMGTMAEFLQHTRLKEEPGKPPASATRMIGQLLEDHEAVIRTLRGDLEACQVEYRDGGSADFLTGLMKRHEKMAWMLRAHLDQSN
jgi:starvation-inducible DNA-binding protein